ncbi:MAG: phenylalanine--tRNA ligase subunit alpha [Anaerolineae bacterium]|nr:phenylalanine--tRNA ligase subunit alpha [Anaerolineae bacterium]
MEMLEQLRSLEEEALAALAAVNDPEALKEWRVRYLGRRGALTTLMRGLGKLPPEERPQVGQAANRVKRALEEAFAEREAAIKAAELEAQLAAEAVDVTLPGRPVALGRLHPTTQSLRRIYEIFSDMGFQIYDAREVEYDEYNFGLLNMPPHHPARDMWDTFWINDRVLLRTHTSPGQIHAMREFYPNPIRVILPGKCYRYEQVTARSEFMFYQVEGLVVGRNITMADLKGTMENFVRRMYGGERRMRLRGSYFPFTEPSVEVDVDCVLCGGKGCRVCKYTGWLEVAGAGMVHPIVLRNGGYDPDEFTGYAFGMGVERPAMLKYRIDDIRYFYSNDPRFLAQI